jgi:ATP-dependent helicase/nuclease subunit B
MDSKREILKNPYCRLLSGLMELFSKGFDYESMFHCLRSGMFPLETKKLDALENYVLALGIRGFRRWDEPFIRTYGKLSSDELASINETREEIMAYLRPLWETVSKRNRSVREYTEGLYQFGLSIGAYERLKEYQTEFETKGELLKAKEYGQVYQLVCSIFEQAVELLGEERVSLLEYRRLLETGLSKAKVGLIPVGVDEVVVGDMERTRLKDIKALFFLGVNDGMVPKAAKGGGILSDMERELLKESQVELAPTRREGIYTEQLYLYLNLTKAEKYLYLTYAFCGSDGKERKPSYLIGKIDRMFPDARETGTKEAFGTSFLEERLGVDKGLSYLLSGLSCEAVLEEKEEHFFQGLCSWYLQNKKLKEDLIKYIEAALVPVPESKISQAAAKALYGEGFQGSVTRLEQYAACAFAHFVSYGLRLRERQLFRLAVPDMGNIFHDALERFSKELLKEDLNWWEISEEKRDALTEVCVEEAATEYGNRIFQSSSRNIYMLTRVKRIMKRTLAVLTEQLAAGSFIPKGYEVTFTDGFYGRIDRLDLYEGKDEVYVKIIDYKSGHKTFELTDLSYGLQLQLVVYLQAAMEQVGRNHPGQQVVPAGIFYYNLDDPIVDKDTPDKVERAILKELRMSGLVNKDEKVLPLLDKSFLGEEGVAPSVKSQVVPAETLKNGDFSASSSVAGTEDFQKLIAFTEEKIKALSEQIKMGSTEINPYKLEKRCACDYCAFLGVCGFDRKREGYHFRKLRSKSKEEVWREINGEG